MKTAGALGNKTLRKAVQTVEQPKNDKKIA